MTTPWSLFVAGIMSYLSPVAITPCSIVGDISPSAMVRAADALVRAVAVEYSKPPAASSLITTGVPDSIVRFKTVEVIKGESIRPELTLPGDLSEQDDFNDHAPPYTFVRPGGRAGSCFANPSVKHAPRRPVENISWSEAQLRFRLPSEAEWEYAARSGPAWRDNFAFSGSNDPDQVAWYGPRWTPRREWVMRMLGPRLGWRLAGRWPLFRRPTTTHDVASGSDWFWGGAAKAAPYLMARTLRASNTHMPRP